METSPESSVSVDVSSLRRPHSSLMRYYVAASFVAGPFFPFLLLPLFFRYRTLRYRFDDEGISVRWGILFRREVHLTYARIQDIHLVSNVVERWMGLARISVQTASGSAKAEMTIEGLREFEQVRDFIYARMRGQRAGDPARSTGPPAHVGGSDERLARLLADVASEMRALRESLERGGSESP